MGKIGEAESSVAAKIASVYELRKYREYKDLIVRLGDANAPRVIGSNSAMLRKELELNSRYFRSGAS